MQKPLACDFDLLSHYADLHPSDPRLAAVNLASGDGRKILDAAAWMFSEWGDEEDLGELEQKVSDLEDDHEEAEDERDRTRKELEEERNNRKAEIQAEIGRLEDELEDLKSKEPKPEAAKK